MTVLRDQIILLGGYELTSSMNAIDLKAMLEVNDATAFGNSTRVNSAGLKSITAGGSGFYDATLDDALNTNIAVHDTILTFLSDDVPGLSSPGYSFKSMQASYTPLKGSVGEEHQFDIEAMGRGDLVRGYCAYKGTVTADANTAGFVLGAASASQVLYAVMHVFGVRGTDPTLDAKIQSDTVGFASPIDKITFDQATSIGAQWKTQAGANTDTYYRVNFDIGGTDTPEFDVAILIGIQ